MFHPLSTETETVMKRLVSLLLSFSILAVILSYSSTLAATPRLHGTILASSDDTVEEQQQVYIPPVKSEVEQEGFLMGLKAGDHYADSLPVLGPYFWNFTFGAVTGPIIPAVAWAFAKGENDPPMKYLISDMYKDKGVIFQTAFLEGFEKRTQERKRRLILVGGTAGTIVLLASFLLVLGG